MATGSDREFLLVQRCCEICVVPFQRGGSRGIISEGGMRYAVSSPLGRRTYEFLKPAVRETRAYRPRKAR